MFNTINFFLQCNEDIDSNKEKLRPLFDGHMVKILSFDPNPNYILCRARKVEGNFNKENPIYKKDLSYHSDNSLVKLNRANRSGAPMFYACFGTEEATHNIAGALLENNAKEGEHFIISSWGIKETIRLVNIGVSTRIKLQEAEGKVTDKQREYLQSSKGYRIEHFLSDLFTVTFNSQFLSEKEKVIYSISTAITEHMITMLGKGQIERDGIIYPSVKVTRETEAVDNIAITPGATDTKLRLLIVDEIVIDRIHENGIDVTFLYCANTIDKQGALIWNGYSSRSYVILPDGSTKKIPKTLSPIEKTN